jgi:hypothetical protein
VVKNFVAAWKGTFPFEGSIKHKRGSQEPNKQKRWVDPTNDAPGLPENCLRRALASQRILHLPLKTDRV